MYAINRYKLFVGIDFGTHGCGLAYAIRNKSGEATVYIHNLWKDVPKEEKPKTSVLFDNNGKVKCHGNDAVMTYIALADTDGWKLFDRFKMSLYEHSPQWISDVTSSKQPRMDKTVGIRDTIKARNADDEESSEKVFVAQLQYLKGEAMKFIRQLLRKKKWKGLKIADNEIQWILTVPAIWSEKAKKKMRDWAIKSGLTNGDIHDQIKIVYEPVCTYPIIYVVLVFDDMFLMIQDCASLSIQHAVLRNVEEKKAAAFGNGITDEKETEPLQQKRKQNNKLLPHRPEISLDAEFEIGDRYILLDVGGGTCDVACHEIKGKFAIAEVLHPSGMFVCN